MPRDNTTNQASPPCVSQSRKYSPFEGAEVLQRVDENPPQVPLLKEINSRQLRYVIVRVFTCIFLPFNLSLLLLAVFPPLIGHSLRNIWPMCFVRAATSV